MDVNIGSLDIMIDKEEIKNDMELTCIQVYRSCDCLIIWIRRFTGYWNKESDY